MTRCPAHTGRRLLPRPPVPSPEPAAPNSQPAPVQLRRWQKASLTTWTAIAVLIVGVVGAAVMDAREPGGSEKVVVATGALSAFTAVTASDVRIRRVPRGVVPAGAVRSPGDVRGHYLLRQLGAGQVVVHGVVGPAAPSPGLVVVPLPVDNDSSAGIAAGSYVDVLLAPTGQGGTVAVLQRAYVVGQRITASGHVVFLAVPRDSEWAIGAVAGRGEVILARIPRGT